MQKVETNTSNFLMYRNEIRQNIRVQSERHPFVILETFSHLNKGHA